MAEAAHIGLRIASSTRLVISRAGMRWPPCRLACTQSSSAQDVVRQVELAARQDVALDSPQHPERREPLVQRGDLLAPAADVVGRRPRTRPRAACGRRSPRTRSPARAPRAPSPRRSPCRPTRWCGSGGRRGLPQLDERRRLAAEGRLAQLGRTQGDAERRVHALLVGRVRQRLERGDVRRRARRAHELGAERLGLRRHELEPTPSTVTPTALRSPRSTMATICGRTRSARAAERVRRGHDPASSRRRRASGARPRRARRPGPRPPRPPAPRPGSGAAPGVARCGSSRDSARAAAARSTARCPEPPRAARRRRLAQLVHRAHVQRAPYLDERLALSPR